MLNILLTLVVAATALFAGANAQLVMNTPIGVIQCQPQLLTWTGGTAPYYLSLYPGGQPTANPLFDFGKLNGTSLTWVVNYPGGTSLGLTLRDTTGAVSQTAPFTVGTSTDSSCLTSSSRSVVSTGTTATTPATGVTTTTTRGPTTITTTTKPLVSTNSETTPTTTGPPSSSTTTTSSSANKIIANSAMVGAIAAAIFAVLA